MKVATPLKAIRLKCYDCSGWNWGEVKKCEHQDCSLFPYRNGKKPKGVKCEYIDPKEYARRIESGTSQEEKS